MRELEIARRLAEAVAGEGGRAYFVGGYVRDWKMGLETKDIDVEIYGVSPARLRELLSGLGRVYEKGASFGVLSLEHTDLDIAMPRRESRTGARHTDFDVSVDPGLSLEEASRRRDFTVNAMMMDVLTGEVIDLWDGLKDLHAGVLRHVAADTFPEDALRVFRAAQFAARFDMRVAEETVALCRQMDVRDLTRERVFEETAKALLKAEHPSTYFETLAAMDHLEEFFPEVAAMRGVPQNPKYHPEGDVYRHTMLVLDQAAALRYRAVEPLFFMFAGALPRPWQDRRNARRRGRPHHLTHAPGQRPSAGETAVAPSQRQCPPSALCGRHGVQPHASQRHGHVPVQKEKGRGCSSTPASVRKTSSSFSRADASGKLDDPYDERLERFLARTPARLVRGRGAAHGHGRGSHQRRPCPGQALFPPY